MSATVLVVDDNPAFRALARRLLVEVGLEPAGEAATVAAALAAADSLHPDAILVDVGLPDGDGVALARRLSALPWHPRVVLTSGDADAATDADARRSGAAAFVPKDQLPNAELCSLFDGAQP
jgi:CheY-like chemotaxis protein